MIRIIRFASCLCFVAATLTFSALPGCNKPKDDVSKAKPKEKEKEKADDHGPGPHGGPMAEWGEEEYHAEFTVDHAAKKATVYILDGTHEKSPTVAPEKITKVKVEIIGKPEEAVELQYDANKSSDKGIAFVGVHDMFAKSAEMKLRISGIIDGKTPPFTGDVTYAPKKVTLATTLGGIYTAKDIEANGNVTPMEKYKGRTFDHGEAPKVGDRICPHTKDKANAECVWIIQGQSYQFCCPPCIGQFLKLAHNEPTKVKDAKEYVLKAK
jgi:hypothetical protein